MSGGDRRLRRAGAEPPYKKGRARSDRPTEERRMATGRERSAHPGATPAISRVWREPPRRQPEGSPEGARGRSPRKPCGGRTPRRPVSYPQKCAFSAPKRGGQQPPSTYLDTIETTHAVKKCISPLCFGLIRTFRGWNKSLTKKENRDRIKVPPIIHHGFALCTSMQGEPYTKGCTYL